VGNRHAGIEFIGDNRGREGVRFRRPQPIQRSAASGRREHPSEAAAAVEKSSTSFKLPLRRPDGLALLGGGNAWSSPRCSGIVNPPLNRMCPHRFEDCILSYSKIGVFDQGSVLRSHPGSPPSRDGGMLDPLLHVADPPAATTRRPRSLTGRFPAMLGLNSSEITEDEKASAFGGRNRSNGLQPAAEGNTRARPRRSKSHQPRSSCRCGDPMGSAAGLFSGTRTCSGRSLSESNVEPSEPASAFGVRNITTRLISVPILSKWFIRRMISDQLALPDYPVR
jgi:hypothetical protein